MSTSVHMLPFPTNQSPNINATLVRIKKKMLTLSGSSLESILCGCVWLSTSRDGDFIIFAILGTGGLGGKLRF